MHRARQIDVGDARGLLQLTQDFPVFASIASGSIMSLYHVKHLMPQ
jgi:hypothetical protein